MSVQGEMVVSPEALVRLMEALQRFRSRSGSVVTEVQGELSRRLRRLEEAKEKAQQKVWRYQNQLDDCHGDDHGSIGAELDTAKEHLKLVDYWLEQVSDSFTRFKRADQNIVNNGIPRAVTFLEEKHERIRDYMSLQIPEARVGSGHAMAVPVAVSLEPVVDQTPVSFEYLSAIRLPSGFQWVKLDAISRKDDLRPEERFEKIVGGEDGLRNGFALLLDEVLPILDKNPATPEDYFREKDQQMGRGYVNGVFKIYESFFGKSSITLDKGRGDGKFGVPNGRHRIHVARSLGWAAVPVKF